MTRRIGPLLYIATFMLGVTIASCVDCRPEPEPKEPTIDLKTAEFTIGG